MRWGILWGFLPFFQGILINIFSQHCQLRLIHWRKSWSISRYFPESEREDDESGEDDDGDEVGEAADLVAVVGEREEELAAARPGHRVRVAAEPLKNGHY